MSLFDRISNRPGAGGGGNNNRNRPVCKFYLEGRCRYGDACHNYHPPRDSNPSSSSSQNLPYHLNKDGIKADLTTGDERPGWPLSAYGPGKDAPRQLIEGSLEQSPEELRVQYYLAKSSGSTQQYEQQEMSVINEASTRAQQVLSDLDGAIKYIIDGKDSHPNREDFVQKASGPFVWVEKPTFNPNAQSSGGGTALGQPSAFGTMSNSAFGRPSALGSGSAFGQASNASTSPFGAQSGGSTAFGQPSALGGGSSAFGQPSALGGSSAFGKPSTLGGSSPFGGQAQSSSSPFGAANAASSTPFGQTTSTGGSAFGQASQPGAGSAFGQASALGSGNRASPFASASAAAPAFGQSAFGSQPAPSAPAFGHASQPGQQTSTFGQTSQPGQQTSPFGQSSQPGGQPSAFGQPSQPGHHPSPFGQSSQLGQKPSPFGQASQPAQQHQPNPYAKASPFAGGNTNSTPAFGQPSFGGAANQGTTSNNTAFGQASAPAQNPSPFAAANHPSAFGSTPAPTQSPFGTQDQPTTTASPFANTNNNPAQPPAQPPMSLKNRSIFRESSGLAYYTNPTTRRKERVWIPDGPPGPNPDVEAAPETYEALGAALKQVYDYVRETGNFKDGVMPEVPPRREWVNWEI